jgi:hypothetical protein
VDGREVEDIEAHAGDLGQELLHAAQGALGLHRIGEYRAREELVPGAEEPLGRVDPDPELPLEQGGLGGVLVLGHEQGQHRVDGQAVPAFLLLGSAQPFAE